VIPATIAGEMERLTAGRFVHRTPFLNLNFAPQGNALLEGTVEQLRGMGFSCRFFEDEATLMWGKLVFLAPFALTTTAADKTTGEIFADAKWRDLGLECIRETCAVAVAEGAKLDANTVIAGVMKMPGSMRSSMQKDVERGNPPELDAIAGPILRGAARHGIEVPATRQLVAAVEGRVGSTRIR
jgi:2-dehydropantoate 2-reductase